MCFCNFEGCFEVHDDSLIKEESRVFHDYWEVGWNVAKVYNIELFLLYGFTRSS